nr:hypothetical protein [Tanacetum cinerariifolium]
MLCQIVQKKREEKRIEEEQAAKAQNSKLPFCYDDEEGSNSLKDKIISELPPRSAITPNEPADSLSMGDEHLNTISATESDEFVNSCVESEGKNGCDVPSCFTTFSNILFDVKYESDSSDYQLNHDSSIIPSSLKIDSLLDEFVGELTLLKSIPPGIDETDCHPENEIRLIERLFDYLMEEMDLSCTPDDPMPPSIEDDDDDDSKRDILIHEEWLDTYSLSLPVNESFRFDIPLFSRPPAKPPDGNT